MPAAVSVRQVVTLLERRYPPALAADWDAVGLTCGDPDASVTAILFAVDPVLDVVDEALVHQVDLIVSHHPLLLRPVHSVAPLDNKGRVLHTLITHGIALYSAHTNADHADPGVSDALASLLGVQALRPLVPEPGYDGVGTGRIGELAEPTTLSAFAERVARSLPATAQGIRIAGDPNTTIKTVALCGGSGDAFLADAAHVADVYVTSDLRHHRAQDHLLEGGCALIDVAHWSGEWPWLPVAAAALQADLQDLGSTVVIHVSDLPTDPWTSHLGSTR
jgi:dinuclear metal center YbgI/SA1388 family protein